jgi:hypothetical protein
MNTIGKAILVISMLLCVAGLVYPQRELTIPPTEFKSLSASAVRPDDFNPLLWKGWSATGLAARQGLRYIETHGDWVLTVEVDRIGSGRASYVNTATGVVDSECVVVGDKIFERLRKGQWTLRTRAEYMAEMEAMRKALDKARSEKDHRGYERIQAAGMIRATFAAVNSQHVPWFGSGNLLTVSHGSLDDTVITTSGLENINGRSTRMYKVTGVNNKLPPTVRGAILKNRHENDYWFDEKTGAIVKARARKDEFRGGEVVTNIFTYEWELDPRIEIRPVSAELIQ